MNSKKQIEAFFQKWGLKIDKLNKIYPDSDIFLTDFKQVFERNVTTVTKGGVFRTPFIVNKNCKNCIFDKILHIQNYYKSLQ